MQKHPDGAPVRFDAVADRLRARFPRVSALMDEAACDLLSYTTFRESHWSQIRSTNPFERLNRETAHQCGVNLFPNEEAIIRLASALLPELNDERAVIRRYMSPETMAGLSDDARAGTLAIAAAAQSGQL